MRKINLTTLVLGGIFLLLLGGLTWQYWQTQVTAKKTVAQRHWLADFSTGDVTTIAITAGDTVTNLQKQTDQWVIASNNNVVADDGAITKLLTTLHDSTVQATVANSFDQAAQYGLDAAASTHIVVRAGEQTVADVSIGQAGKAMNTWYGSRGTESVIYLLSGSQTNLIRATWEKPTTE